MDSENQKSSKWVRLLATFFYLGELGPAPGTLGTLGAIPVVLVLVVLGPIPYMVAAFTLAVLAILVAQAYESTQDHHDASEIVIDEVVGFVIAMTWLPLTWQSFLLAFILFRILDILKPFPIGWLDRRVQGGVGVVVDDVAAGLMVNGLLQFIYVKTNWLGHQLTFLS